MDGTLVSARSHRYSPQKDPKTSAHSSSGLFLGGFWQKFGAFIRVESHQKKDVPTQQHGY
jgi:hypothetical protein